ncbi:uncharacterized protein LOC113206783 [Frankliniella occidentalis]|uniref:Uncharacterized protein LOC113206783 n=1 Tax=Frankliniella occidentalis TaxID=133901 RepID=A0A6J1SCA2_FRAOC|nr:uncharacterized protein LOC113206783 [Frankliniella occidentalis]
MSANHGGHRPESPRPRARCRMATPPPWVSGLVLLLALAAVVLGAAAAKRLLIDSTHLELRPKFIRPCEGEPDNALQAIDVTYEMRGRTTVVFNLDINMSRTADKWTKGFTVIERCDETVSEATCKVYRVIETNDVCGYFMNPTMPWVKLIESVQPKLSCPIPKGTYRVSNGTLAIDLLSAVSGPLRLEGYVWRARPHCVDDQGSTPFCLDTAGELFRVRNHPKDTILG